MAKKEIIVFTGEERQRYLMDSAGEAILKYGAQFECKIDKVSLLIAKKELSDEKLKEMFGDNIINILNSLRLAVANMVSYRNGINNKRISKEDVSSVRFLKYKESLAKCYEYLFLLDKMNKSLSEGTEAESLTVPSHYWSYITANEVVMPEDLDESEKKEEEESG